MIDTIANIAYIVIGGICLALILVLIFTREKKTKK